jgi:hypothetical protein
MKDLHLYKSPKHFENLIKGAIYFNRPVNLALFPGLDDFDIRLNLEYAFPDEFFEALQRGWRGCDVADQAAVVHRHHEVTEHHLLDVFALPRLSIDEVEPCFDDTAIKYGTALSGFRKIWSGKTPILAATLFVDSRIHSRKEFPHLVTIFFGLCHVFEQVLLCELHSILREERPPELCRAPLSDVPFLITKYDVHVTLTADAFEHFAISKL